MLKIKRARLGITMTNEFDVKTFSVIKVFFFYSLSGLLSVSKHQEKLLFIINSIYERCTVHVSVCKSCMSSECFSPRTLLRECTPMPPIFMLEAAQLATACPGSSSKLGQGALADSNWPRESSTQQQRWTTA